MFDDHPKHFKSLFWFYVKFLQMRRKRSKDVVRAEFTIWHFGSVPGAPRRA